MHRKPSPFSYTAILPRHILLYCHGISMNAISKLFGSLVMTVLKWIRAFAKKHTPKPTLPPSTTVVLELDEMWHYIGNKKTNFGYGKHLKETPITLHRFGMRRTRHTDA